MNQQGILKRKIFKGFTWILTQFFVSNWAFLTF